VLCLNLMITTLIHSWNEFSLKFSKFDADALYVFSVVFIMVRLSDMLRKEIGTLTVGIVKKKINPFLDAFTKFRKAIISFIMSVRPSVRMD